MATTNLRFNIRPYLGGEATADGAVTPTVVVPTTLFLITTDAGQVAPDAAGYALSNVAGWLYEATVPEALVGVYYWYVEDADSQVIADGFVDIEADDANTYYAVSDASAIANSHMRQLAEADLMIEEVAANDWERKAYRRGTSDLLFPAKKVKQTDGTNLTNPDTHRLGGFQEE